jgi:invasion protein IalB
MKYTTKTLACIASSMFALGATAALAQQPAPAQKAPAAAPAAAPSAASKGAAAAAGAAATPANQTLWVKLCEKIPFVEKDKDGKEARNEKNVCLTHHERLDGNSGNVLVSAAIRQVDGAPTQQFMVMVPLGMAVQPGMQAAVYDKDQWDKLQKSEKFDESKVKAFNVPYSVCHGGGCTGEIESSADIIKDLKAHAVLVVYAMSGQGEPIAFPVPLDGFEKALAGPPVDNAAYSQARRAAMQQIAQRQQQLLEEYKKQNADINSMQGNKAFGNSPPGATPAAAAGGAPAAKAAQPPAAQAPGTQPPAKK